MNLDEALDRAMADKAASVSTQCMTCQLVRDGLLTDEKLAESVKALGAPMATAVLRSAGVAEIPGPDSIRRHLANHVVR